MTTRPAHAWFFFGSAAWSSSAYAHGDAMVLGLLLQFGFGGGLFAGVAVFAICHKRLSFAWPFAVFLGILAIVAAIWAETLIAIPYAIAYGAFAAFLPFVLAYYAARYVAALVHTLVQAHKRNGGSQ